MKLLATLLMAASLAAPFLSASAAEEKPAASAGAAPHAAAPTAPAKAKPDVAKGAAIYNAVCLACHGEAGNSSIAANPKLAQQHPEYLVKQLQEFKSGKRASAIMKPYASALNDEDMRNISYWAASQKAKPGFAKEKDMVSLGERIYRGGIADRQIAACAGCHSPNGAGIPAQFPRLSGQQAEYTAAQLVSFRDGARRNSIQMNQIAAKMNDREIKAVADYVAGLR